MVQDVGPVKTNTTIKHPGQSWSGRMLTFAPSEDGKVVFTGSYSNLWASEDGGQTWDQIVWAAPWNLRAGVQGSMGGWCVVDIAVAPESARWLVDRDVRVLADLRGSGQSDIVGFGFAGVWSALGNGDGSFRERQFVVPNFGYEAGGWRVEKHPRLPADLTGDGRADIVGFGDAGVWTALSNGDGTFHDSQFVLADFGHATGWRVEKHPRLLADMTGNGRADIVGFGDAGVYVALSNGDGSFTMAFGNPKDGVAAEPVLEDFGYVAGSWRVEKHPRFLADITGDGRADIVGFGDAGVYVALSNGDGSFTYQPQPVIEDFGYQAGGWRVEKHPRFLADVTGDGRADIVGFGDAGVWTALSNGNGTFQEPQFVIANFGYEAGGWRVEKHPRFLADLTGNGRADIVGFGEDGVWTALSNGDGTFQEPRLVLAAFGYEAGGWRVEKHPRFLADLTGNGRADIIGFGDAGVWTALGNGDGTFQEPRYVLAAFGYERTVLAITRNDRELSDNGIWRSTDGGRNWMRVHQFPQDTNADGVLVPPRAGQLIWAPGSDRLVYAAGESALAISRDGGASFQNVLPRGGGQFERINHVAVGRSHSSAATPPVVYALANNKMFVSFDGGANWIRDQGLLPPGSGGPVGTANSRAPSVLAISPRSPLEVFLVANDASLWRGDYTQIFNLLHASSWEPVVQPNLGPQDSGNVFVATTQPGHRPLLFYGPHRAKAFVGPLDPQSPGDWKQLDEDNSVHVDLHGIFLSPDFDATFEDGEYKPRAGTVWLLSDGGVHRSTDGGKHFQAMRRLHTLSCVNVAGVAIEGRRPALSLNTGDNDGFYSMDGGAKWTSQEYGGGDNDCSYADPLRPHSILVFTPRWDRRGHFAPARLGQTVTVYEASAGKHPDGRVGTNQGHTVPGPPLRAGAISWNATSTFGMRGFRPIVLSLPDEEIPPQGDHIFIRFKSETEAVLLRTFNILDIDDRNDWDTTATAPADGVRVFQQGPPLPSPDLGIVQASGGHAGTVFYVGGNKANELWTWTEGMPGWERLVPGGWRVGRHPRFLADLRANGRADIVGFGDAGVWTALNNGGGTFQDARFVIANFGYVPGWAGAWQVEKHPRSLADLRGNGRADIVGFGDAGVWTALSNADGDFQQPQFVLADLGYETGWRVEKHPRLLADITGDGRADIVGFGDAGVYVALSNGDGSFTFQAQPVLQDLGYEAGGWRVEKHPRFLADLTGDGRADIVGFGDAGVYVALSNGDGSFTYQPRPVVEDFGYEAGGWRVEKHPRILADVTGDGRADIIGFGDAGVWTALSNGNGMFQEPQFVIANFGYEAGGWRVEKHPRFLADLTGNGRADIVGFGDAGVWTALSNGDGTFQEPRFVLAAFGYEAGGWRVEKHPRFLADLTGNGRADIVGFGDAGVWTALGNGDGTFQEPHYVLAEFGYDNVTAAYYGPEGPYVVGGASEARRFFVDPYRPKFLWLLDKRHVMKSEDGGQTWDESGLDGLLTLGGRIPIERDEQVSGEGDHVDVVLTDMQFDPRPMSFPGVFRVFFAVGSGGAFVHLNGQWRVMLHTGAVPCRPTNCYYDWISNPDWPSLYVALAGRSLVKIKTPWGKGPYPDPDEFLK
jgi:hypothetical protein